MKKSLTEQWKDGELPDETYYWKKEKDVWIARGYEMQDYLDVYDNIKIECLAPVPSYNEYKRLKEQLKEAVDFIEELSEDCDLEGILYPHQRKKLEEIEKWGVK